MSEKTSRKEDRPEELTLAEAFIDDAKVNEAHELLDNFEKKEGLTLHDKVSSHLLKCNLLTQQGLHENALKLAEQTYKESLGLGKNLLSVDTLMRMAIALIWLNRLDKAFNIIKQGEELLKTLPQELSTDYKQREAYIALLKGWYYDGNDVNQALKQYELSLALRNELGIKHEIAESLSVIAQTLLRYKGESDRALKYAEKSLAFAKESSKTYYIASSLFTLGVIHMLLGEFEHSIRFEEQSLEIFKELNNKPRIGRVLHQLSFSYKMRGGLDRALECIEQAMAISRELGNLRSLASNHDHLIQILIDRGDLERAQQSLNDYEQLNSRIKDKYYINSYLFVKALVLNRSIRSRDRGKAERNIKATR